MNLNENEQKSSVHFSIIKTKVSWHIFDQKMLVPLHFFINKNSQWMVPTFFDQNMLRNLGFYDRKMNWTFLLIFSSSSLKNWTKFSSSSLSKKVNWVQFKVHQKSELLNWTELFRSVQSLPCKYVLKLFLKLYVLLLSRKWLNWTEKFSSVQKFSF